MDEEQRQYLRQRFLAQIARTTNGWRWPLLSARRLHTISMQTAQGRPYLENLRIWSPSEEPHALERWGIAPTPTL